MFGFEDFDKLIPAIIAVLRIGAQIVRAVSGGAEKKRAGASGETATAWRAASTGTRNRRWTGGRPRTWTACRCVRGCRSRDSRLHGLPS